MCAAKEQRRYFPTSNDGAEDTITPCIPPLSSAENVHISGMPQGNAVTKRRPVKQRLQLDAPSDNTTMEHTL